MRWSCALGMVARSWRRGRLWRRCGWCAGQSASITGVGFAEGDGQVEEAFKVGPGGHLSALVPGERAAERLGEVPEPGLEGSAELVGAVSEWEAERQGVAGADRLPAPIMRSPSQ